MGLRIGLELSFRVDAPRSLGFRVYAWMEGILHHYIGSFPKQEDRNINPKILESYKDPQTGTPTINPKS